MIIFRLFFFLVATIVRIIVLRFFLYLWEAFFDKCFLFCFLELIARWYYDGGNILLYLTVITHIIIIAFVLWLLEEILCLIISFLFVYFLNWFGNFIFSVFIKVLKQIVYLCRIYDLLLLRLFRYLHLGKRLTFLPILNIINSFKSILFE